MNMNMIASYRVDGGPETSKTLPFAADDDFVVDDAAIFVLANYASSQLNSEGKVEILDIEVVPDTDS